MNRAKLLQGSSKASMNKPEKLIKNKKVIRAFQRHLTDFSLIVCFVSSIMGR
jgi:hypothetical protein